MTIRISYDHPIVGLYDMPAFSKWFTENDIIPNIGEKMFVPDDDKNFPDEVEESRSGEWVVTHKFYSPHKDKIDIWCRCINHKDE